MTANSQPNQGISKSAVDAVAEKYWSEYFSDSGYGKLWVRKIPMRVRAALATALPKSVAKTAASAVPALRPLGVVVHDDGVTVEGIARYANKQAFVFVADFSDEGEIQKFDVKAV